MLDAKTIVELAGAFYRAKHELRVITNADLRPV